RDDEQTLVAPARADRRDEAAELGVGERDLAVVGPAREGGGEARRRIVGAVRIVEVDPEEEALRRRREPGERGVDHLGGRALGEAHGATRTALDAVVVDGEALVEAEAALEDARADEGGGRVAGGGEAPRERRHRRREAVDRVVPHAVGGGLATRQQ